MSHKVLSQPFSSQNLTILSNSSKKSVMSQKYIRLPQKGPQTIMVRYRHVWVPYGTKKMPCLLSSFVSEYILSLLVHDQALARLIVIEGQMSRAGSLLLKFCLFTRNVYEGIFLHILSSQFLCFQMSHLNTLSVWDREAPIFAASWNLFIYWRVIPFSSASNAYGYPTV